MIVMQTLTLPMSKISVFSLSYCRGRCDASCAVMQDNWVQKSEEKKSNKDEGSYGAKELMVVVMRLVS